MISSIYYVGHPYKSDDPALTLSGATLEPVKVPDGLAASPAVCNDDDASNVQEV